MGRVAKLFVVAPFNNEVTSADTQKVFQCISNGDALDLAQKK